MIDASGRSGGQGKNGAPERRAVAQTYRFDFQTGPMDREAFQQALLARAANLAPGSELALIWIDLINLRREFSLLGWTGAESLARRVASALIAATDGSMLLGRVGSCTFVVAIEAARHDSQTSQRIQALVDGIAPQRDLHLPTSPELAAGVAFYPFDTDSLDDLARFASMAASRAAYVRSHSVVAFNPGMNRMIVRDHLLEVEMRKGFDSGEFSMVYQPKIDLITGRVLGAEGLIRWQHPDWGPVSPSEFIPVAERSGLIHRLFHFGLRTALEQMQQWQAGGIHLPLISVNASAANVCVDTFADSVRDLLLEVPIGDSELELEMTESLAFDDEELFHLRMQQLKAIGVRIAIDDFGTRYTGFNVLHRLALDTMKIDRCFIRGIDRSPEMRVLFKTIVAMARQLKMRTVAEGIEEAGELEVMRQIGCEAGQGYLFQRPVDGAEFAGFLRQWPERLTSFGFTPEFPSRETGSHGSVVEFPSRAARPRR